jgi:hypothetical protein
MKRLGLALLVSLLLLVFPAMPSRSQGPTPEEIKACQKDCKRTYKDCLKNGGDPGLCEAAYAFCNECCTGGCREGAARARR